MSTIKELKADKNKFKNDYVKYVEITNLLAVKYRDCGRNEEALAEHLEAINICSRIKNEKINYELEAVSRRALGEYYSEVGKHSEALNEHKKYLSLAIQLDNSIEIQRAHATIGRTYLLYAESDEKSNSVLLKKSQHFFQKALDLCENLMSLGKLKSKEYAEMKSRLLLNLGLVYENLYEFDKCKTLILDSIALTKANFLLDELFRCQISMGAILEKTDSMEQAVYHYEQAVITANSLKSKRKKFDAYLSLGLAWMKQENSERGKYYFKKAHFLNVPGNEDREKICQILKITLAIIDDLRQLSTMADDNLEMKINLCDKLGDHFVALKCFTVAIKYYKKQLLFATEANKSDLFLSRIYVSIGQTYLDDGKYEKAIEYFNHEYNFQLGNTCEQCCSLLKIADIQECFLAIIDDLETLKQEKLRNEIKNNYENALKLFDLEYLLQQQLISDNDNDGSNISKQLNIYKMAAKTYLNFLETNKLDPFRQRLLNNELSKLNNIVLNEDETNDYADEMEISTDIYDQYNLDNLSNDSVSGEEAEDEEMPTNFLSRPRRRNFRSTKSRLNQFGETPLHTACIAGNLAQVQRLLEQDAVDINAKDFCGWTPLHEAANHGFLSIVEYLINNGADIESCDDRSDRITPLHDACNCGHLDIITLLLNSNANILAVNVHNETPLQCLISWRERSQTDLSKQEIDNCLALENKMLTLMKDKNFDLKHLFKRNKSQIANNSNNNNNNTNNSSKNSVSIRSRNLVKDFIYSTENSEPFQSNNHQQNQRNIDYDDDDDSNNCNEYRSTMDAIRYFNSKSHGGRSGTTAAVQLKKPERPRALVNEDEEAPRDDWLIDDLRKNGNNKKRTYKRNQNDNDEEPFWLEEEHCNAGNKKRMKSKCSNIDHDAGDDVGNDNIINLGSPELIDNELPRFSFNNDCLINENNAKQSKRTENIETESSGISRNIVNTGNRINSNRKAINISFNDKENSSFMVFIQNESDCKWLKNELIRRYFVHYGTKPLFSLRTDDNAILLDTDLVIDIINNDRTIKAVIDSWTVDQPDKRFVELATIQNETFIDKNIEACLRKSLTSLYLNLNGIFFPSKTQINLMFKALLQQNIKELDISFTNLLITKENFNAFHTMVISLPNLEELYLSGVTLSSSSLINFVNLNHSLRKLDLSFNPLGDDSIYSLAQIINTFRRLEYFNLDACQLTERFLQNQLMINSLKNSNLTTLSLEYNDFPMDIVNKFKSLNINRMELIYTD